MNRSTFIRLSGLTGLGMATSNMTSAHNFLNSLPEQDTLMPVLFLGHGSPMNAIEDNKFTREWKEMVKDIPKPKAILVISAHWETKGTNILAVEQPKMIYDMYGFPKPLYEVTYPCKGDPELAEEIKNKITFTNIALNHQWGLDHGAWSILTHMYPDASIPCLQLSLSYTRDLQWHYDLAKELSFLRKRGVLIVASGNIVHNLREIKSLSQPVADWAVEFDTKVTELINKGDHTSLINYEKLGRSARTSVNSAEHYIPLLYTLALQGKNDPIVYANDGQYETLLASFMRCVRVG